MIEDKNGLLGRLGVLQYELDAHKFYHVANGKNHRINCEASYVVQNVDGEKKAHFGTVYSLKEDETIGGFFMIISGFDVEIAENRECLIGEAPALYTSDINLIKMGLPTFPLHRDSQNNTLTNPSSEILEKYSKGIYRNGLVIGMKLDPHSFEAQFLELKRPSDVKIANQIFKPNIFSKKRR